MRQTILLIILFCALLSFLECNNCNSIESKPNGDYVHLRLLRDGKNAVFGTRAFIDWESILYSNLDPLGSEAFLVTFNDSTQSIKLFIEDIYKYQLELGTFRTYTLEGISRLFLMTSAALSMN